MEHQFWTEKEIEEYVERFSTDLLDSNGNKYSVEASRMTWDWFLIFTNSDNFKPEVILDRVLKWQKTEHPSQELSYLFEEYIAFIVKEAGPELCNQMFEEYKKTAPDNHPLFCQFKE